MIFLILLLLCLSVFVTVLVFRVNRNHLNQIFLTLFLANFILGHILLLTFRLVTQVTNPVLLGDRRLIDSSVNLHYIILLNILQFFCIQFGYLLSQTFWRNKHTSIRTLPPSINRALIGMTIFGWIGNIAVEFGQNNLFSAFHPFEILGTLWIVSGFRLKDMHIFHPIFFGTTHLIWAIFFFHSKSEAFVILVALLIRLLHVNPKNIKAKISGIVIMTVILFPFIQTKKGIETASAAQTILTQSGSSYSAIRSYFIGILQRFDGADSITDAYLAGGGIWYNAYDYSKILISKFIPNVSFLVGDYFGENSEKSSSMGQLWNDQVRPHSVVNVTSDVPVTYGPLAEGYAISGLVLGILLSISFGILISKFCDLNYSNNLLSITIGMYFISHLETMQNSTGTLILMLPKALQCFLMFYLLKVCLSSKRLTRKKFTI
jgi:hypothetical protein